MPAQRLTGHAQVHFQHLTDVHTGRHAQRIQHDLQGRTVGQEGHILFAQDAGHNALVAVTAGHLVAHADLTLLSNVDANHHVHAGAQLVLVLPGEDLHVHHDAALAVRHAQRGVADFAGLFTEDGAQQAFFCGQIGLALRRYLTDQNIAGVDLRTDADDTVLVQILHRVVADVGNIAGDLFRSQFGLAGLGLELFNMNGGVNIVLHQLFADQNGVLVVVAFPGHETDEHVAAQADLTVLGRGAIRQQVALFNDLTSLDAGTLVDAGALIGTGELAQMIGV